MGISLDLAFSARTLASRRGQAFSAIVALGLGIGLPTAAFSILTGSLPRNLLLPGGQGLMRIERLRQETPEEVRPALLEAWQRSRTGLSSIAPWFAAEEIFTRDGAVAESYHGAYVSSAMFSAAGVGPWLGRAFRLEEDRPESQRVVVLGYALWKSRYHGDPQVLGRRVWIGGDPAMVIGVMPAGFTFPAAQDYWASIGPVLPFVSHLEILAKLHPGSTRLQAQSALDAVAQGLEGRRSRSRTLVVPFVEGYTAGARRPLLLMACGAGAMLLIACFNLANLLLVRALARERELFLRAALGAGRARLASLILADAFLLALLGAAAGLAVAGLCIRLYNTTGGFVRSFWVNIRLDGGALGFAAALTLLVALVAGSVPAFSTVKRQLAQGLKESSQGVTNRRLARFGKAMLILQAAFSIALLTCGFQMLASVHNLYRNDFGARPEKVWTTLLMLDASDSPHATDWLRFYEELAREVRAIPGVRSAALASHLPGGRTPRWPVEIENDSHAPRSAWTTRCSVVSPGYFATLGRRLLTGRDFADFDRRDNIPVVLINRSFATRHFSGRDPLNRRLRLTDSSGQGPWLRVVGVVPDLYLSFDYYSDRVDQDHPDGIYLALAQHPEPGMLLALRSDLEGPALLGTVRRTLAKLDPNVPALQPQTLLERVGSTTADYRLVAELLSVLSMASLALTAAGLYAVVSSLAAQRRREVAIRIALGAPRRSVLAAIAGSAASRFAAGTLAGFGLAAVLSRLIRSLLYGISPADPRALGAAFIVLVTAAVAASIAPVRRSTHLDLVATLRDE